MGSYALKNCFPAGLDEDFIAMAVLSATEMSGMCCSKMSLWFTSVSSGLKRELRCDRGMNSLPFCLLVHSNWRRKQVLKDSNCLSLYGNEEGLSALLHNLTRTRDCARHRKGLVQMWLILEFLALTLSFISVIFIYLYMLLLAAQAMWVMAECLDFSPLMWLVMCPLQANILSAGLSSGYPFTPLLHPDYL